MQVLTNSGALDRDKQLAVVRQLTDIVAAAAGDPALADRTWVLLTEAPEGGWGISGHANTNAELVTAARAQLAELGEERPGHIERSAQARLAIARQLTAALCRSFASAAAVRPESMKTSAATFRAFPRNAL